MFAVILTITVVFGILFGTRESLAAAADGRSVADSRYIGVWAGIFGAVIVFCVLMALWGVGAFWWFLVTL
jgi:hypothetical protein